jgi:hypothetical protein
MSWPLLVLAFLMPLALGAVVFALMVLALADGKKRADREFGDWSGSCPKGDETR